MSSQTPVTDTATYRDLDLKLQSLSAGIKTKLTWLTYAAGLTDRIVETRKEKPYIYPAIWQGANYKDPISMMPSDLYPAFCFWVKGEMEVPEYNFAREWFDVACIFFCDLKHIAPTTNYRISKTYIRQDVMEAFRQNQYGGYGVIQHQEIIEEDLTKIYDGYSIEQVENKYKMLPKYALRLNFRFGLLKTCGAFNTYA